MGRQVKRVPIDFKYPMNQVWVGYISPYKGVDCKACDGSGESPEYKQISDDWYGFDSPEKRWCHNITDDEAKALFDAGRLKGDFSECPTGSQVNAWAKDRFMGHDAINKWICVKQRAERLGITEAECSYCKGCGVVFFSEEIEKLIEEFEGREPPIGEAYQLWETTSEGSPISPVFEKPEDLAQWLYDNKASSFGSHTQSYEQWLKFITGAGWAMSAVMVNGELKSGVDALVSQ